VSLIASILVYYREKNARRAEVAFVLVFLGSATPLHFILVGYYLGSKINNMIYNRWSSNWGVFIVSILGIFPLFGTWELLLRLLLTVFVSGKDDVGGFLVLGVGFAALFVIMMLVGLAVYLVSSFVVSYRRRGRDEDIVSIS
jgi:hypothetical protein